MSKLSHEALTAEITAKGYTLLDDSGYTNMNSDITIQCPHGHKIITSLSNFRKASFVCPVCDKNIDFLNPKVVPQKHGYRIIAFDQATENFGLSIFDDGQLVFYNLYRFSGDLGARLVKIRKLIQDVVIREWCPDFICYEDIQYQHNGILTFKVLAMLLGVVKEVAAENDIETEVVSPNVWRKYAGTAGKDRRTEKMLSKAKVKEKYNIDVSDDVAEAILIGSYAVKVHLHPITTAFGR